MDGTKSEYLIPCKELNEFTLRMFKKVGMGDFDSKCVADALLDASIRGVDSHGVMKIRRYVERYSSMEWGKPEVVMDMGAIALYDGHNYSGFVTSTMAMQLAIEKAKQFGAGIVGVKNSGHFGMTGHYSMMAPPEEMIGWAFSNAGPLIPPWGAAESLLGNNPWSYAVPSKGDFPIVLDIGNSIAAYGKVHLAAMAGKEIPSNWALDKDGNPTTDPNKVLESKLFMPFGEYKGYGITVMMDILSGVLTGSAFANDVTGIDGAVPGTGHMFGAIDIKRFRDLDGFYKDLSELCHRIKSCKKQPGVKEVYLPGEIEYNVSKERLANGIPLNVGVIKDINEGAAFLGEKPLMNV